MEQTIVQNKPRAREGGGDGKELTSRNVVVGLET